MQIAVASGDRHGQPGLAAHVALTHRSGHRGQPHGRPAPDGRRHGRMRAAIGTAGPGHRECAAVQICGKLLPGEPPPGWTGAGGGSGSPRERPILQDGECFTHNAVPAAASPAPKPWAAHARPCLLPAHSVGGMSGCRITAPTCNILPVDQTDSRRCRRLDACGEWADDHLNPPRRRSLLRGGTSATRARGIGNPRADDGSTASPGSPRAGMPHDRHQRRVP